MSAQVIPFQTSGATRFRSRLPLTLNDIRGQWRPSGYVGGLGVFSVVWQDARGTWFVPLHMFSQRDQLRLIEQCRAVDQEAVRLPLPEVARR